MRKADNDNDELSFITLGAATLNVVKYLETTKQKQEDREREAQREADEKEKAEQHRRTVDQRLREIASFEERASGRVKWKHRRL